jgi:Putative S-adenosyl-L-methionine-dependent methyltransferase
VVTGGIVNLRPAERCTSANAALRNIGMQTVAAWLLQHYQTHLGSPAEVAFIELGPGKGTLMKQVRLFIVDTVLTLARLKGWRL